MDESVPEGTQDTALFTDICVVVVEIERERKRERDEADNVCKLLSSCRFHA